MCLLDLVKSDALTHKPHRLMLVVSDELFRDPEAQLFENPYLFKKNPMSHVVPIILVFITQISHSATSAEKGRYAMRKWKHMSYHKLRNAKKLSVFPTMLDTQTVVHFVLSCKQIHVSSCQKLCFCNSLISIVISDGWFKRSWRLWNANIGLAFNYCYVDLIIRLRRYFAIVAFTALIPIQWWLLTFNVRDQACLKPICQQTWHLFLNLLISFFFLYSDFPLSRSTLHSLCSWPEFMISVISGTRHTVSHNTQGRQPSLRS